MQTQTSVEIVINSLALAGACGRNFDELEEHTGLPRDHLDVLVNNLGRNNKISSCSGRLYIANKGLRPRVNKTCDSSVNPLRKKRIETNLTVLKKAINHHNAVISMLTCMMQGQIDEMQIERLEAPPEIKYHEIHSGPRKVLWDDKERAAYRKSFGKTKDKQT